MNAGVAAILVVIAQVFSALFPVDEQPRLEVGANIYLSDIVCVALAVSSLRFLLVRAKLAASTIILLALCCLYLASLARGLSRFALQPTVNAARETGYFLVACLFFSACNVDGKRSRQIGGALLIGSAALLAIAAARWAGMIAGFDAGFFQYVKTGSNPLRVLNANITFFLCCAGLAATFSAIRPGSKVWLKCLAAAVWPAVIVLEHRSVWVAIAVGAIFLAAGVGPALRRRLITTGLAVGVFLVFLGVVLALGEGSTEVGSRLRGSVAEVGEEDSTLAWRIDAWIQNLEQIARRTPSEVLTGAPYGVPIYLFAYGRYEELPPHNYYVATLLSMGVAGLVLLVALYGVTLSRLWVIRARRIPPWHDTLVTPVVLLSIGAAQMVFLVPYQVDMAMGMFLGLALNAGTQLVQRSADPSGEGWYFRVGGRLTAWGHQAEADEALTGR